MRPLVAVLAILLTAAAGSEAAAAPEYGVFATINGKKMKAPSTGRPDDPCVFGFYQASGGVVFTAGECRGSKRRRIPRKSFQQLVFACGVLNAPTPPTPPYEAACIAAVYAEARTRRGVPFSQSMWTSSIDFELGEGGTVIQHSSINLRVESFDGTYVRGTFSGVFDMPQQPGTPAAAAISGEGRFHFPVRGVQ